MAEDPYAPIADIYDFSYEDFIEDVDFYENLARSVDGPILELGVGSGRAAIPLAEAGYEVVGIDYRPLVTPELLGLRPPAIYRSGRAKRKLQDRRTGSIMPVWEGDRRCTSRTLLPSTTRA